ncbi:MAG: cobalt transporter CbiM [Dehalococcoidales bacterium]|nr:cobalt transporter CbiM [Dehalococcoidales bacterium]
MHIPDGYLSPETCVVFYGAAVPIWYKASQRMKKLLNTRSLPLVSIFAAFAFTIQMLNIPIPGGTTAHAVGGTLMAIVLGPWPAVIGMSVALAIQAIFFGDGGITALGANSFNMAIALPLTGYLVYRLLSGNAPSPRRRAVAAAIGGYVGINVAGLLTGIELGVQPLLWSEGGRALYNPYGLETTVPAMMLVHLTLAGFAEAALTGLATAYLLRAHPTLFVVEAATVLKTGRHLGRMGWALVGALGVLVVLTPLGLLAPGGADFEWGTEELRQMVGYVPGGLARLREFWRLAPLPDYGLPGFGAEAGFLGQAFGYILSAIVGVGLIFVSMMAIRILLVRRGQAIEERS